MRATALIAPLLLLAAAAQADEGMWTFNRFPADQVQAAYGFKPDAAWLDRVRLASVRLAQGCSGSFVSAEGLVMTNHHCIHACVEQLSTPEQDRVAQGFLAKTRPDEVKCPDLEVNQLVKITDVTDRIAQAVAGKSDADANAARKAEMSRIEKACATSDAVRCDVVSLYEGGVYDLYEYRRYQDVRLVFAPELAIAFFGGDPDNFNFPRYALDSAFVRVYEGDKPAATPSFFSWSEAGTKAGDLTFVTGHPGRTSRLKTVAELASFRNKALLRRLLWLSELRGALAEYGHRGAEQARHSRTWLFYVENGLKAYRGEAQALLEPALLAAKEAAEKALRARVAADPRTKDAVGAWDAIAAAVRRGEELQIRYDLLERGRGFQTDLFGFARTLVRLAAEQARPNEERLREYTDGNLPAIEQELLSAAPLYDEFETFKLAWSLTKLREQLGPDDALVKQVLGNETPDALAARLVKGSTLKDPAVRKALRDGGAAALAASKDPVIALVQAIDAEARAVRKAYEDEVEAPIRKNHELIARARFALEGTNRYPDATFTLRLSYGAVQGWPEGGRMVEPFTTIAGAFGRHTGAEPFALPESWLKAKDALDGKTPFNLVTTNDIIGGNSGSPVIDKDARIVGLIFDGNIHSLGGDHGFDARLNRAVAVDARAILHALDRIYGAKALATELRGR